MMRAVHVILAAALVAVPAACDDPGGPDPGSNGETQPPPASEALASREVQVEGYTLMLEITELKRQGQAATLSFRITNTGGSDEDGYWPVYETLGTGPNDYTVSGVVLVDPVNAQRYLVARSGGEDAPCACSQNTSDTYLYVGDSAEFFATYAAPPSDVTTVNVEFPTFGAYTDVPISS